MAATRTLSDRSGKADGAEERVAEGEGCGCMRETARLQLSPTHRLRALVLLSRFVSLGGWAVGEMLAVGVFPYLLKLLLSPTVELRPALLFLWCRILLYDPSTHTDLVRDPAGFAFFCVFAMVLGECSGRAEYVERCVQRE